LSRICWNTRTVCAVCTVKCYLVVCPRSPLSSTKTEKKRFRIITVIIDGRIILRWIFRKLDRGIDWIDLAQDRDRWRSLINAEMNLRVP